MRPSVSREAHGSGACLGERPQLNVAKAESLPASPWRLGCLSDCVLIEIQQATNAPNPFRIGVIDRRACHKPRRTLKPQEGVDPSFCFVYPLGGSPHGWNLLAIQGMEVAGERLVKIGIATRILMIDVARIFSSVREGLTAANCESAFFKWRASRLKIGSGLAPPTIVSDGASRKRSSNQRSSCGDLTSQYASITPSVGLENLAFSRSTGGENRSTESPRAARWAAPCPSRRLPSHAGATQRGDIPYNACSFCAGQDGDAIPSAGQAQI
jgi:hypothetical protein